MRPLLVLVTALGAVLAGAASAPAPPQAAPTAEQEADEPPVRAEPSALPTSVASPVKAGLPFVMPSDGRTQNMLKREARGAELDADFEKKMPNVSKEKREAVVRAVLEFSDNNLEILKVQDTMDPELVQQLAHKNLLAEGWAIETALDVEEYVQFMKAMPHVDWHMALR